MIARFLAYIWPTGHELDKPALKATEKALE